MATTSMTPTRQPVPVPSSASRPSLPRRSSSLHKLLITKLRPLPFQYEWSVWHSKSSPPSKFQINPSQTPFSASQPPDTYQLSLLVESVADIGAFYRIFNNLPWSDVREKDSIHIFRAGVKPLWEDEENINGGRGLIRVKNEDVAMEGGNETRTDVRTWEEICLLCLGGELQSVIAQERDHILGVSFSPRTNFTHISIWTKQGDNQRSILLLERAILSGLSPDLRPKSTVDFNYRKHMAQPAFGGAYNTQVAMHSRPPSHVHMIGPFLPSLPTIRTLSRPALVRGLTVG